MLKCCRCDEILPKANFMAKQLRRRASQRFCVVRTYASVHSRRTRAGLLFFDIVTSDILTQFLGDRSFFRIGILCKALRSATKTFALVLASSGTKNAWRLTHVAAYHTHCTSCMQYVLREHILTRQHVCPSLSRPCARCGMLVEAYEMPGPRKQVCHVCWTHAMDTVSGNEWAWVKCTL